MKPTGFNVKRRLAPLAAVAATAASTVGISAAADSFGRASFDAAASRGSLLGADSTGGSRGAIVFVSQRVGGEESRAINADGSGLRHLPWSTGRAYWAWSPNGKKIAYWRADGVYVMNANGTGSKRVSRPTGFGYAWSPDGGRLAYFDYSHDSIYVVDLVRGATKKVASGTEVSWSPRGDQLAFLEERMTLVVTGADGADRRLISEGVFAPPAWSPDGTQIAYVKEEADTADAYLWVARADGTNAAMLTPRTDRFHPFKYSADFEWSPRGDRIVFHALNARDEALVVRADGRGFKSIAQGLFPHTDAGPPTWSPDGAKIAFVRDEGEIWVMNADGSHKRRLTRRRDFPGVDLEPRWEPRGRRTAQLPG